MEDPKLQFERLKLGGGGGARSQFEDPKPWDVMSVQDRAGDILGSPSLGKAELKSCCHVLKAKGEQLARDREVLEEAWQELGLEEEPCGSSGRKRRRFQV